MKQPIWIWWFLINSIIFAKGEHECGVIKRASDKIVGGYSVDFFKYPWYAGLFLITNPRNIVCGSTLISSKYVLTAAHCFKPWFAAVANGKKTLEEIYIVKLGVTNVCMAEPSQEIFETIKVYVHENYEAQKPYFDITLIELNKEATNFMPICLPIGRYESNNRTQELGIILGLGKESSSSWGMPCTVKQAEVPIQLDSTCRDMLTSMKADVSKLQGAFCAGYLEGKIDTCQGDSGGPLQVKNTDGTFYILGITSFGYGCAQKNVLGVYTDVSHYLDWIYEKIGKTPVTRSGNNITTESTPQFSAINQNLATRATIHKPKSIVQRKQRRNYWHRLLNNF